MSVMQSTAKFTILIGNPGAGKSTLLNGLCPHAHFQSGISFGTGLTQTLQFARISNDEYYCDTPGLSDFIKRVDAAKEIEIALKKKGLYRIIFVLTLEAGRVRTDDAVTINLVLNSLDKKIPFGVIINKVTEGEYEELIKNPMSRSLVKHSIFPPKFSKQDKKTVDDVLNSESDTNIQFPVHLISYQNEMAGMNDIKPPTDIIMDIQSFLQNIPYHFLHENDVRPIDTNDYQHMSEELGHEIEELKKHYQFLQNCIQQKSLPQNQAQNCSLPNQNNNNNSPFNPQINPLLRNAPKSSVNAESEDANKEGSKNSTFSKALLFRILSELKEFILSPAYDSLVQSIFELNDHNNSKK